MTIILIFSQMSPVMADNAAIKMQMGRQSDINKQPQQMHSHNQSNCYLGSFLQLACYQPLSFYSDQTCRAVAGIFALEAVITSLSHGLRSKIAFTPLMAVIRGGEGKKIKKSKKTFSRLLNVI